MSSLLLNYMQNRKDEIQAILRHRVSLNAVRFSDALYICACNSHRRRTEIVSKLTKVPAFLYFKRL